MNYKNLLFHFSYVLLINTFIKQFDIIYKQKYVSHKQ